MDNEQITDTVFERIRNTVKQFGGLINPWLWLAVLAVIYIGQTLAVQIFLWIMVIVSALVVWYPRLKTWWSKFQDNHD